MGTSYHPRTSVSDIQEPLQYFPSKRCPFCDGKESPHDRCTTAGSYDCCQIKNGALEQYSLFWINEPVQHIGPRGKLT